MSHNSKNFPEPSDTAISKINQPEQTFEPYQNKMINSYASELHQTIVYDPKPILQRLFPSQAEKLVKNKELEAIATQHEYQRKMLEIIGDGLCEDLKLRCAKHLEANRIKLDTLTKKIVLAKFVEFRTDYNNKVREIFKGLKKEFDELDSYPENIREQYEAHLYRNFQSSIEVLEAIWNQFINNLIDNLR